jgi:hypothetical protein
VITNDLHRSRLNAVSFDFASWVESIRKAALNTEGGVRSPWPTSPRPPMAPSSPPCAT